MDLQSAKCQSTPSWFTLTGKLKQCVSKGRYKSFKSPVWKPQRNLSPSVEWKGGGGGDGESGGVWANFTSFSINIWIILRESLRVACSLILNRWIEDKLNAAQKIQSKQKKKEVNSGNITRWLKQCLCDLLHWEVVAQWGTQNKQEAILYRDVLRKQAFFFSECADFSFYIWTFVKCLTVSATCWWAFVSTIVTNWSRWT